MMSSCMEVYKKILWTWMGGQLTYKMEKILY